MKRTIVSAFALVAFVLALSGFASAANPASARAGFEPAQLAPRTGSARTSRRTFTGEIMDSACAQMGSHAGMMKAHADIKSARACTLGCVKAGAKFVLYDPATKMIYELDNQVKPRAFAGDRVRVTGTYNRSSRTITVATIHAF